MRHQSYPEAVVYRPVTANSIPGVAVVRMGSLHGPRRMFTPFSPTTRAIGKVGVGEIVVSVRVVVGRSLRSGELVIVPHKVKGPAMMATQIAVFGLSFSLIASPWLATYHSHMDDWFA